jgi:hypothetical protein
MNEDIFDILLKVDRDEEELNAILAYMGTFKDFQYLEKLSNHKEILRNITGLTLLANQAVYECNAPNDQ